MATLPKISYDGNTTTIGFPAGMSQASIVAALKKQAAPTVKINNTGGDRGLANRAAAAKAAPAPAKSTSARTPGQAKAQSGSKGTTVQTKSSAKPKTTTSSAPVGSGYDGNAFVAGAMDQFGYNPNLGYTPIDTSKMMDLLGKWDPNSISDIYKPAYDNLDRLRQQGKDDYAVGDLKLADMYDGLQNNIRNSAIGIQQGYDTARNNINSDGAMLSNAAAQDAMAVQNSRAAMLKNLGVEAAAPDLVANDNVAAQTGQRVTQAAGVQSNLASLLGANAGAYAQNTANNAGLQGNEARSGLLTQLNDYMGDLAGKQSDIDTSRSQAVASGYQNYQDAYRQLGIQKMQFDMQNNQNSYNASNQNNQNAMSMYQQYQQQQAAQQQAAADSQSAWLKAQQDSLDRQQSQSNWEREQALRERTAAGRTGSTDLYSAMQQAGAQRGVSGASLNSVLAALNGLASRNGLGNSPGAFADAAAKVGVTGVDPNTLAALAAQYWQASGAKASGNVY